MTAMRTMGVIDSHRLAATPTVMSKFLFQPTNDSCGIPEAYVVFARHDWFRLTLERRAPNGCDLAERVTTVR